MNQDAQGHVNEWKAKASNARHKVEEARSNQSENRSRNNVLDSLTRLRDAGNNEGFHVRKFASIFWVSVIINIAFRFLGAPWKSRYHPRQIRCSHFYGLRWSAQ